MTPTPTNLEKKKRRGWMGERELSEQITSIKTTSGREGKKREDSLYK
jgi:hypothetical protein